MTKNSFSLFRSPATVTGARGNPTRRRPGVGPSRGAARRSIPGCTTNPFLNFASPALFIGSQEKRGREGRAGDLEENKYLGCGAGPACDLRLPLAVAEMRCARMQIGLRRSLSVLSWAALSQGPPYGAASTARQGLWSPAQGRILRAEMGPTLPGIHRRDLTTRIQGTADGRDPLYPRAAVAALLCCNEAGSASAASARRYLLAQRKKAPGQGKWSLPGGKLELGEGTLDGAVREVAEETGLSAGDLVMHPHPITTTDAIYRKDGEDGYAFHYCIAQVFAWVKEERTGAVQAGDDAAAVAWFSQEDIRRLGERGEVAGNVSAIVDLAETMVARGLIGEAPRRA